jgi:GTP-binding protein
MIINKAEFEKSSARLNQCPTGERPELAFIGRSNVGKSSLINLITGRKSLAKISVSPGKTKLINHFLINDSWYLVDLPGYGYAKASKKAKEIFSKLIQNYILKRDHLMCMFVLLDIRIDPQANDLSFINWLGNNKIPFVLVYTKTDKLNQREISNSRKKYEENLLQSWENLPKCFFTSSVNKTGRDEILTFIESLTSLQKNSY